MVDDRDRCGRTLPSPAKFLCITVDFNTARDTERLINSVQRQRGRETMAMIVVDNSPLPDGQSAIQLRDCPVGWEVAVPGHNLGYLGAACWAFESYRRKHGTPEWTIVCNPDIELVGEGVLEQLTEISADRPPAVIAPSILSDGRGRDENPFLLRRPSAARMRFYKQVFRWRVTSYAYEAMSWMKRVLERRLSRHLVRELPDPNPREIYAPHGSCVILHRGFFEAGAHLRHGCFLFGEEIFVAEQSRNLGLRVVYVPRIRARHCDGTKGGMMLGPTLREHLRDSAAHVAGHFFPR